MKEISFVAICVACVAINKTLSESFRPQDSAIFNKINETSQPLKRLKPIYSHAVEDENQNFGTNWNAQPLHNGNVTVPYNITPSTYFIELYVINDFNQFKGFHSDLSEVQMRTKEIIKHVNSLYREVGMYAILTDIETWTNSNPIETRDTLFRTHNEFGDYLFKNRTIISDVILLLIGNTTFIDPLTIGITSLGKMCHKYVSNVAVRDYVADPAITAGNVVHEIGHLFGLLHRSDDCKCRLAACVMDSSYSTEITRRAWSECSLRYFAEHFKNPSPCLLKFPDKINVDPTCGNGIMEENEECDCGLEIDCNSKCCVPLECKLAQNAVCANGMCCDLNTCQYKNRGVKCRPSTGCCDLPEYCTGDNGRCPDDAFLQNGAPCQAYGEESICYDGQCQTYNGQCQSLWDYSGKAAEPSCYQNNFYRNCDDRMRKDPDMTCEEKDIRCGLIQCLATPELPRFEKIVGSSKTTGACRTARYTINPRINNGLANDGSKCNLDSICISNQCVKMSSIGFPKSCSCTGTGICNHLGECYYGEDGPIESCKINISSKGSGLILAISLLIFFALAGAFAIILSKIIVKRKELRISRAQQSTQEAAQTET